jgi:hypothetical protein
MTMTMTRARARARAKARKVLLLIDSVGIPPLGYSRRAAPPTINTKRGQRIDS